MSWLIEAVSAFLTALFSKLGRAEQSAEQNKEAADAERRASEAKDNVPDVDGVLRDLDRGKF